MNPFGHDPRPARNALGQVLEQLRGTADGGAGLRCIQCGEDLFAFGDPRPDDYDRCQRCAAERARERRIAQAIVGMIPEEFRGKTLDDYLVPPGSASALATARAWHAGWGHGLWFCSEEPGSGKSHLAYAIAQRVMLEGRSVEAHVVGAILGQLKATFGRRGGRGETFEEVFERIEGADLVLLDDIGAEKVSDWVLEQLFRLVNARYAARRPLIVTSNYEPGALALRFGEVEGNRIVSRLVGMCELVRVDAGDYRMSSAMARGGER